MCTASAVLHICPIKQLYQMMEQGKIPDNSAAVLCTTADISSEKMGAIPFLHMEFSDILNQRAPDAFCMDHARAIRLFVDSCTGISDLYFCCDSGESRSAALVAATMHYLGQDEMAVWKNTHYRPNPLVYYLQSRAYDLSVTEEDAQELYHYNQHLFAKQIRMARKI